MMTPKATAFRRNLFSVLLVIFYVTSANAQSSAPLIFERSTPGRNMLQTNFIRLGELCDSLQGALNLTELEVVPVRKQGSRTMRRLDDKALRATLTEMFTKLGLDMALPNRFTPTNANVIFGAILEAAAISPPTVVTWEAEDIQSAMATLFGMITDDGRKPLDYWGFKFGTDSSLTDSIHVPFGDYQGFLDTSAVDTGMVSFQKSALSRYTTYYYAAWAENEHGIAHGDTLSFTTLPELASGLSISSSNVEANSADVSLSFTDNGGQGPDSVGFWWDDALIDLDNFDGDSAVSSSTADPFVYTIADLTRYTKYYYTGYVSNLGGRSFVQQPDSFITAPEVPVVALQWNAAANRLEGHVTDLGGNAGLPLPDSTFVALGTEPDLSNSDTLVVAYTASDSSFVALGADLGLDPGEAYYAAGFAANAAGIGSSSTIQFHTLVASSTDLVTDLVAESATLRGSFDFGASSPSEVGFKWGASADLSVAFDSLITLAADSTIQLGLTGLTAETDYYYTTYATNEEGTSFGDTLSFTTKVSLTDDNIISACQGWITDSVTTETLYGPISRWDVGEITDLSQAFRRASSDTLFNSDISSWDVGSVTDMSLMFQGCLAFNQDISGWDVSSVTTFYAMFYRAASFNQNLNQWDVSEGGNMERMFMDATSFNQPLNDWIVSSVTTMGHMFRDATTFNQPLSNWDVSSVTRMTKMFDYAEAFNQPLENWNVSNVMYADYMFSNASVFNQDLNAWNTSSLVTTLGMFEDATQFNGAIGSWNTSNVTEMARMFTDADSLNQDLSNWDVGSVKSMVYMFNACEKFNGNIGGWDVSNVTNMEGMFGNSEAFNQPIGGWNVALVKNMKDMFKYAAFNEEIGAWDVSSVTNMNGMFQNSSFNQDVSSWNVSNVTDMGNLFWNDAAFNQDIGGWDVSSVTNFERMLSECTAFDQDLSTWDVSSGTIFYATFAGSFNFQSDLSGWDVDSVTTMNQMFDRAGSFNSDLSAWDIRSVTDMDRFANAAGFSTANYDAMLEAWSGLPLKSNVNMKMQPGYCYGAGARQFIIDNFGWNITDNGSVCDPEPSVSADSHSNVATTTADVSGSFANMSNVSEAGFKITTDSTLAAWSVLPAGSASPFSLSLTDLTPNTTYYYRAYAVDDVGTAQSESTESFQTQGPPLVSTIADTTFTDTTATLVGVLDLAVIPAITATGFKVGALADLSDATDVAGDALVDTFTYALTASGPLYYAAYATNALGTSYGDTLQLAGTPEIETQVATAVTETDATLNGSVRLDARRTISATGFTWGYQPDLSDGQIAAGDALSGDFSASLTGLTDTTIYFSAFAISEIGTTHGDTLSRYLMVCETVEYDGYVYQAVAIGSQCWFAEDLRTTTYNNGDSIPTGLDDLAWINATEGARSDYDNDAANVTNYGRLYNGFAVSDSRGLCPSGWHVSTHSEMTQLTNFLGGALSGSKLKSTAQDIPAWDGTNSSGFSAVPGGFRDMNYGFYGFKGSRSFYWTSTADLDFFGAPGLWRRGIITGEDEVVEVVSNKKAGLSVRCIRSNASAPLVTTAPASSVTSATATLNASVHDGWKALTATGFMWGYQADLSDGTLVSGDALASEFVADLTGLTADATVYFAAFASNALGTSYGDTLSFVAVAPVCGGLDVLTYEGYNYKLVPIGNQCWFAENLRTTNYSNGDAIPYLSGEVDPSNPGTTPFNDAVGGAQTHKPDELDKYGRLYNWAAASDARGVCPTGWHVPTPSDFQVLHTAAGGGTGTLSPASLALKASPTDLPYSWDGNNATGFTALPGGVAYSGGFEEVAWAYFWSDTESPDDTNYAMRMKVRGNTHEYHLSASTKKWGLSIRCIAD